MTATHTPGPWTINEVHGTNARTRFFAPDGRMIFEVWDAITDEDARLIAASPNLLEALKALLAQAERYLGPCLAGGEMTAARAAIAQAKGMA